MFKPLAALLLLLSTSAFAAPTPAPAALAPLLASIQQRLAVADQVALSKWDSGKAVEDRPREHDVIVGASIMANDFKVPAELVEPFFSAQIEANKLVQYARLAEWHLQGKAPDSPRPDLAGAIRPKLDELQKALLKELADFAPYRQQALCPVWLAAANRQATQDPLRYLALTRATAPLCASKA